MSRREVRDSDSNRHRSRFDREPSPKRSRRDRKPIDDKVSRNSYLQVEDSKYRSQKHELHHKVHDTLPREPPMAPDSKQEGGAVSKGSNTNIEGKDGVTKHSSNPTEVSRSRTYFQHDERGNAGQVGRSFSRNATSERGWWKDTKNPVTDRAPEKTATYNAQKRDEKSQSKREGNSVVHRDGPLKTEVDAADRVRKRPAFREKKITDDSENVEKPAMPSESKKPNDPHYPPDGREWREERGRDARHFEKLNKQVTRDMTTPKRDEMRRGSYPVREKYGSGGSGGNHRGGERFSGRQGYRSSGTRVEKWKHDLFHEANRSPTPKNEEDQIAKLEALLTS